MAADDKGKWYFFNDAEVKPFDPSQLAAECFGGETTSKTYDSASEKFMDLSFEKTNSAYMLFYERKKSSKRKKTGDSSVATSSVDVENNELFQSIWRDNMQFIADRYTFDTSYFEFMWQMCETLPQSHVNRSLSLTAVSANSQVHMQATQLAVSHLLDTYIHSKDKASMLNWNDLLLRQFAASSLACHWFVTHLIATDMHWCKKLLLKCPNMSLRHIFHRILLNVLVVLLPSESELVERFLCSYLDLLDYAVANKCNVKLMHEYFGLLCDLAKSVEACHMMLRLDTVQRSVKFYMLNRQPKRVNTETIVGLTNGGLDNEKQEMKTK